jgi:hypothetical protein
MTPMDMCLLPLSLEAIERVYTQENPTHNPSKKLVTGAKRVTRDLLPILQAEFPRKPTPRNNTTFARNMELHVPRTIPRIVVGLRKTERKNPSSLPPRKAERNPIPQSSLLHR